jgi:hypothetical protein
MATSSAPHYVIDTSSIIHWYVETYPPELLPKLPDRIDRRRQFEARSKRVMICTNGPSSSRASLSRKTKRCRSASRR